MSKTFAKQSEFPLQWPPEIPRSARPQSGQFRTSLHQALQNVTKSLARFGSDSGKPVTDIVISSNVTLGSMRPSDAGVSVYFTWDGLEMCIPIDRYDKVEDNLQAIHHCIEADRTNLRHGGAAFVRARLSGQHTRLLTDGDRDWPGLLGLARDAGIADIRAAYRRLAKTMHPDVGGNADDFARLTQAYEKAVSEKERRS